MEIKKVTKKQVNSSGSDKDKDSAYIYVKNIDISLNSKNDSFEINILLTTILDSLRLIAQKDCDIEDKWLNFLSEFYDNLKDVDTISLKDAWIKISKDKK